MILRSDKREPDPDLRVGSSEDPDPSDRVYYRHKQTGNRGFIVERGGKEFIKLDRVNEEVLRPWNQATQSQWQADGEWRPLSSTAIARVCYEADRALLRELGDLGRSRVEWLSLKNDERIAWVNEGPVGNKNRKALYDAIQKALRPLVR